MMYCALFVVAVIIKDLLSSLSALADYIDLVKNKEILEKEVVFWK